MSARLAAAGRSRLGLTKLTAFRHIWRITSCAAKVRQAAKDGTVSVLILFRFLGASLAVHVALLFLWQFSARQVDVSAAPRFVGTTFEVETTPSDDSLSAAPRADGTSIQETPPTQDQGTPPVPEEPRLPPNPAATPPPSPPSVPPTPPTPSASAPAERHTSDASTPPPPTRTDPPARPASTSPRPNPAASRNPQREPAAAHAPSGQQAPSAQQAPAQSASPQGAYGASGLPAGVMQLRPAFVKTLPLAAKSDPAWLELPLGPAGKVDFVLRISDDHRLEGIEVLERPGLPVPEALRRLLSVNRNFLLRGRFAIDTSGRRGAQRLRLQARVLQSEPDSERPEAEGVNRLGQLGGSEPTGAYFTYYSGRRIEFEVTELR